MLVADGEKRLTQTCGLVQAQALELMQPLHAQIDEQAKNKPLPKLDHLMASCESDCHCGLYADLAETPSQKEAFYRKASQLPRRQLIACALKTSQWVCQDPLFESLKQDLGSAPVAQ